MNKTFSEHQWALILGASSGFGGAAALELARRGMNIFGVHFDRAATMPNVERIVQGIQATGAKAIFFNINASDPERRKETVETIKQKFEGDPEATIRVLMHSLAFGTLKPFIGKTAADMVSQAQIEMTVDVMAHSLVYWTQDVVVRGLMKRGDFS